MAELVRDDEPDLTRLTRVEQVVEEHDPPCPTETRDVGILPACPTACVGDEHISDRHARTLGERTQLAGERRVAQRPKTVEERLEHDRPSEAKREHEQRRPRRRGSRPGPRQRPGESDESENGDRTQHSRDREALRPVEQPATCSLRRETPPALAEVPTPERERQTKQRQSSEDEDREKKGPSPPRKLVDNVVQPRSDACEGEQRQSHQSKRRIDEKHDVERPVVAASALDLVGREHYA